MVTTRDGRIWDCVRDYWRLEITRAPLPAERLLVSLRGRRRTTEPYCRPVVLDGAVLERLNRGIQSAMAVIAGFQATGILDCRSTFPRRLVLARCYGPFYELEIIGTIVARDIESVELAVTVPAAAGRPVVHLIDADIELFAADFADASEKMNGRCLHVDEPTSSS